MQRSLIIHSALAGIATILAYAAWAAPKGGQEEETVTMVEGKASQLTKVVWTEPQYEVVLTPQEGKRPQVTLTKLERQMGSEPKRSSETFPGTPRAQEILEGLAPFQAIRKLGSVDEKKKTLLGLHHPTGTLTLGLGSETKEISFGNGTYGLGDLYAMGPDSEVYLVKSNAVEAFKQGAGGLIDRSALAVNPEDVLRAKISMAGLTREVIQRYREDRKKAYFADTAQPEEKLQEVSNWLDRVMRLRMVEKATQAPVGSPRLQVALYGDGGLLVEFSLWAPGESMAIAKSSAFGAPITVTKAEAEAVLQNLEAVMKEGS